MLNSLKTGIISIAETRTADSNLYILLFPFALIVLIALIFFQTYLSRKENKWYGVFMPALSFCIMSVLAILFSTNLQMMLLFLILFNIPSVIFFIVHAACRETLKKNKSGLD